MADPTNLNTEGDSSLLHAPARRAFILSRGERSPLPVTPWIEASIHAAQNAAAAGESIVLGCGRAGWDCALLTCAQKGGAAIVVLENEAQKVALHDILPGRHLLVWSADAGKTRAERALQRDLTIASLSNCAVILQLRNGGNMERVLNALDGRPRIDLRSTLPKKSRALCTVESISSGRQPESAADCLVHFTRAPLTGQWPREPRADYIRWLCSGPAFTPRDDFQTLRRILLQRRIVACGTLIRGHTPMVCFSAQPPSVIRAQTRWRKGLSRWSFSNYAILFRKSTLESLGARPVDYVETIQTGTANAEFRQPKSSAAGLWTEEQEWRIRGDLDFSSIPVEDISACVAREDEGESLRREFGVGAWVLG